jgi:hypothetical protein
MNMVLGIGRRDMQGGGTLEGDEDCAVPKRVWLLQLSFLGAKRVFGRDESNNFLPDPIIVFFL